MNFEHLHRHFWYELAGRLAIVLTVFAIIISVLMIANFIQTKSIEPLNNKAFNQLMLQLQQDPQNTALKEQVRALDLLARKAYFTNQWQIRTGSFLLFGCVLLVLVLLKYRSTFKPKYTHLAGHSPPGDSWESRILTRKYIIYSGLSLFILAFISGIMSESALSERADDGEPGGIQYASPEDIWNNWPGFRGPEGNGIAAEADYPTEWDGTTGKHISWKTTLPVSGFSSPIFWENRLFLSGADKQTQVVFCVDAHSGAILWQTELNAVPGSPAEKPRVTEDTGYAAATMTTDGYRVFVIFATGDIACLDFEGAILWSKNLGVPDNHYGHSSSLITYKNLLLVQYDHNKSKQLIALNTINGQEVYRKTRDVRISWTSPILVDTGERMELILSANPFVISYDPQTGNEWWRIDCMDGETGPSPAFSDGMVFVVNEFARLAAIELGDNPEMVWEYEDDLSEVASPVATPELLFIATSFGPVSCFDTKTGERYWMEEFDEGFYSSPILVGDLIYLIDMNGHMYIFKAGKEFNLVGEADLGEGCMTIPAFINGRIFIRGNTHLFCIAQPNA